jgi:hypothetical protein
MGQQMFCALFGRGARAHETIAVRVCRPRNQRRRVVLDPDRMRQLSSWAPLRPQRTPRARRDVHSADGVVSQRSLRHGAAAQLRRNHAVAR